MSATSSATTSRSSSPGVGAGAYTRAANEETGRFCIPGQENKPLSESRDRPPESSNFETQGHRHDDMNDRLSNSMNRMRMPTDRALPGGGSHAHIDAYPEPELDKRVEDVFSTVQVRNLSRNITEGHLKEIFGSFGTVLCLDYPIELKAQRQTGLIIHRGYAFVDFNSKDVHDKVMEQMDQAWIDGSQIDCLSSNGQRSAMNVHDREHYLKNLAVPAGTIETFFRANYEYSRLTRREKKRGAFGQHNHNHKSFLDKRQKLDTLPTDVYFPNRDKEMPRSNPYGRDMGRDDRRPDVYRPGKPYGKIYGSEFYQGPDRGFRDRFPDRDRRLRAYSPLRSPPLGYPRIRRSPSPGPLPMNGRRFGGELGARSPDPYRRRRSFSRSPPPRRGPPIGRSPSPYGRAGLSPRRFSSNRFRRSPSPLAPLMRVKKEYRTMRAGSRSPLSSRSVSPRPILAIRRGGLRSPSPIDKHRKLPLGRGRDDSRSLSPLGRRRAPIGGRRGRLADSESRSPSPGRPLSRGRLPPGRGRPRANSRSRDSRSRSPLPPLRNGRGRAPLGSGNSPLRGSVRSSVRYSRTPPRSRGKPSLGSRNSRSRSSPSRRKSPPPRRLPLRSRSRSFSPPMRRRKLSSVSISPPRRGVGGRRGPPPLSLQKGGRRLRGRGGSKTSSESRSPSPRLAGGRARGAPRGRPNLRSISRSPPRRNGGFRSRSRSLPRRRRSPMRSRR